MSEATPEYRDAKCSVFWLRVSLIVLGLLCAINVFGLVFVAPKFMQIYADMAPGLTLPEITEFIMAERVSLVLFTLALTIPVIVMFWRRRPYAIIWINLGIIWFFVQGGVTVYALMLPMLHLPDIFGMPDAGR